jgi:hypothetical protein
VKGLGVTRPAPRWFVVIPWALTIGLFACLLATAVIAGQTPDFEGGEATELVAFFGLIGLWGVADATMGALIVSRRPRNPIGRLLLAGGPLIISVFLGFAISGIRILTAGSDDLLGGLAGWWASIAFFPALMIAWPLVGILFPDGHLPSPRWRWPVTALFIGQAAASGISAIRAGPVSPELPNSPFGIITLPAGVSEAVGVVGTMLFVLSLVLAIVAVAVRWRRGDLATRAQLKWLLGSVAVGVVLFPLGFGGEEFNILDVLGVLSATSVPIAIAIAVLRYRLYEIDRIISRTLTYGLLTIVLVGTYLAGFAVVQSVLVPFTRGGGSIAVAASTLVVFALFQPLRRRLRALMDRRFNRSRYDGQRTVEGFAANLRDEFDLDRVGGELAAVVERTLAPTSVGVWLRPSARITGR